MLKQSCNQLPDAITRSRIFCDHLSQCAMVVGVLQGLRNARERAMYSNIVLTLRSLRSLRPHLRSLRPHPSKPSSLQRPPPPLPPPSTLHLRRLRSRLRRRVLGCSPWLSNLSGNPTDTLLSVPAFNGAPFEFNPLFRMRKLTIYRTLTERLVEDFSEFSSF